MHATTGAGLRTLPWLIILLALGACNGSTQTEDDIDVGDGGGTEFIVGTGIAGEPVPGQTVTLVADVDQSDVASYRWEQTDGPPVALARANAASASFRVPALPADSSFEFTVTIMHRDGSTHVRRLPLRVEALSWHGLAVVEAELHDAFVVFRANKDNSLRVDLYRADLDGGNIARLNGPLIPGGNVHSFSIAPDGSAVAYLADEDSIGVHELYVVPAGGGLSTRVSGELVDGGNVSSDFLWSPDASRIAYHADQRVDERFELFVAHADGDHDHRVSGDMTPNGDVINANFYWRDDSQQIAYRANQFNDNTLELFVSDHDGSGNVRVSAPPVVGGGVLGNFAWQPGGQGIAYVADLQAENAFELFVVQADGSDNTKVSGSQVSAGSVVDAAWAPDGSRLAYRAEQISDGVQELYSVLPDGTDNTLLSALPATGDVNGYQWAPDGTAIAYLADQVSDGVIELFVTGPDGASNRRVSGALVGGGAVAEFTWSPAGDELAYRADQLVDDQFELFVASTDGAGQRRVSGPLTTGGDVEEWRWTGDSAWLIYRADQRTASSFELFSASPDGATNLLISGALPVDGDVASLEGRAFDISPDGSRVVYVADQNAVNRFELFVTTSDSGVAITSISGTLTAGGDVLDFALSSHPDPITRLSGVLHDVPLDALQGWSECWREPYNTIDTAVADILADCDGELLMLACRPTGTSDLTLAAWGPRALVTQDTGQSRTGTTHGNGAQWYFNDNWSWGFAGPGDEMNRNSCDIGPGNDEQRLCWHTSNGKISNGYRCGATTGTFGSDWERMILQRDP